MKFQVATIGSFIIFGILIGQISTHPCICLLTAMKILLNCLSITFPQLEKVAIIYNPVYSFTCLATAFARSLHVSVFPVPAGPSGAPPRLRRRAPIRVL